MPNLNPSAARLSLLKDPLLSAPFSQKVWLFRKELYCSIIQFSGLNFNEYLNQLPDVLLAKKGQKTGRHLPPCFCSIYFIFNLSTINDPVPMVRELIVVYPELAEKPQAYPPKSLFGIFFVVDTSSGIVPACKRMLLLAAAASSAFAINW
jgi:hypothetical protein